MSLPEQLLWPGLAHAEKETAMHLKIFAAQQEVELPDDPYELLPGLFPRAEPKEQRALVKQLVLTALNAKDIRSACSAFRNGFEKGHPGKQLTNVVLALFHRTLRRLRFELR